MFALPSMGSNPFCWGSFWGVWGTFFKKSPTKTRPYLDDLRKNPIFWQNPRHSLDKMRTKGYNKPKKLAKRTVPLCIAKSFSA
jgi:hypothetical protein